MEVLTLEIDKFIDVVSANLAGEFNVVRADDESDPEPWFYITYLAPSTNDKCLLCSQIKGDDFILKQFSYASDAMNYLKSELMVIGVESDYKVYVDDSDKADKAIKTIHWHEVKH